MTDTALEDELSRAQIDEMTSPVVLEFGASSCGICKASEPLINEVRERYPHVQFLWVEDGPGKRLGRSFRVKLWPTLVFMRHGQELARVVRPSQVGELVAAYALLLD